MDAGKNGPQGFLVSDDVGFSVFPDAAVIIRTFLRQLHGPR